MNQHLSQLTKITGGDVREVCSVSRMNAIQDAILALAGGENISTAGGLIKAPGVGRVRLEMRRIEARHSAGRRFVVTYDANNQRLYVGPGSVAWVDKTDQERAVLPEYPTLDGTSLKDSPYWDCSAGGKVTAGRKYGVLCVLRHDAGERIREMRLAEADESGDGGYAVDDEEAWLWEIATVTFTGVSADLTVESMEQKWESDIYWDETVESSSSGSGSVPDGSSESGGGDDDYGSGSGSEDPGSDKSTAIVPASWSPSGFAALFVAEMPEVRFDDVLEVALTGRVTVARLDRRFVEVCAAGSIMCCGWSGDRPGAVGVAIAGDCAVVTAARWAWARPVRLTLRLSGVRKGFKGQRFPFRTARQFTQNEAFINSAYEP
jgi:hypothetical protein